MKTDHNIDKQLIEAYKNGDGMALAALVRRWHKLFCDKAYWMVKDKDVAKDIAQDSWTIIINKIDQLSNPKQFKYWALRIVCNKSTDWLRSQARNEKRYFNYYMDIENKEDDHESQNNLKARLLNEIDRLPTHQKIIIKLFYLEDYSLKQISELLNISVGTVKSRLFHAREKLKKILKQKKYEN